MVSENSKQTARPEQPSHYLQIQGGDLSLKRVPAWFPNGAMARQGSAAVATGMAAMDCRAGYPECIAKLDIIIRQLRALLLNAPPNLTLAEQGGTSAPTRRARGENKVRRAYKLTAREGEVLTELMEGKSNRQIAEELIVSVSTVKCHVSNILSKMGAKSRTEAVAMALRQQGTLEDRQKSSREEIRMLNGNKKRGVRAD